jgi:CrcB protein
VKRLILVILCGGLGSGARYLLGGWVMSFAGPRFPFGTITINLIGSFLIAAIMAVSLNSNLIGGDLRVALTTGVMGGFTTYSSFNYESLALFQQGAVLLGLLNILVTVFGCLIAGWLGFLTGRILVGA